MIAFRAVSSSAQAAAASITLSLPSDLSPGDLVLVVLLIAGGSGVTITPPSGFTSILGTNSGVTIRQEVFRHRYTEESAASVTFTFSGSHACVAIISAYGGVDHASPVNVSGGQANASSEVATAPSVVTTRANVHLAGFWGAATGAPTATPPTDWNERADLAGSDLALSSADRVQGTAGASGTKVATLSGAAVNIGMLVALEPAALNTADEVRDEGGWRYEAFAPRITSDTAFDAFVEGVIQRANREVFRAVGASFYADNVLSDPWNALLQRAEMHLAQSELLNSAAGLVGTADAQDEEMRPYIGKPGELRAQSFERRRRAREIIALCRTSTRPGPGFPFFTASGSGVTRVRPLFDDVEGLSE